MLSFVSVFIPYTFGSKKYAKLEKVFPFDDVIQFVISKNATDQIRCV